MDFETMNLDTLDPRLLSKPVDYEVADGLVDFSNIEINLMDFDTTTSGDLALDITKPSWTEPNTINYCTKNSNVINPNFMDAGCVDFSTFNLDRMARANMDCGMPDINTTMGLGGSDNSPIHSVFKMGPYSMMNNSVGNNSVHIGVLENDTLNGTAPCHSTIPLSNPDLGNKAIEIAEDQEIHSRDQILQSSTASQSKSTIDVGYSRHNRSTNSPLPTLPRQFCPGGSAARKRNELKDWKEYRPKSLGVLATRAKITTEDWQEHRPFIEQLYLVENMKLKDMMQTMEIGFGFVATEKMYKTKITQWGLMKNYKASEKEHLARIFKAYRDSGRRIPPLNVRNRAAKMSRVRRYCKQQQILEEICDALPAKSTSKRTTSSTETPPGHRAAATNVFVSALRGVQNSSSSMLSSKKLSFDPERPFSTASKDGRIELILFQTKIYAQSQFDCTTESNNIKRHEYTRTWRDKLKYGAEALRRKRPAKGWQMIHDACEMTHQIFLQLHQCFLRCLLHAFHDDDMAMYPELRTHLLRFFTKVSARTLGCNHPISVVLYHWQEHQIFADVVTPIFEVMMDVSGEDIDPTNDEAWRTKDHYCSILKRKGDYAAAESHGLRILKQSEEIIGRLHWRTRSILLKLGITHRQQGLHELAESEFQDILQRGHEDLGDQFPDTTCVSALQYLAYTSEEREDFAQCNEYWRQALAGAIKKWGMGHDLITSVIGNLEIPFKRQGMDLEAWLQQNFGISWI